MDYNNNNNNGENFPVNSSRDPSVATNFQPTNNISNTANNFNNNMFNNNGLSNNAVTSPVINGNIISNAANINNPGFINGNNIVNNNINLNAGIPQNSFNAVVPNNIAAPNLTPTNNSQPNMPI